MVGVIEIPTTSREENRGPRRRRLPKSRDRWSRPNSGRRRVARTSATHTPDANWQAIEVRTNGTAASDVTSQTLWSAAYINAPILQDSFTSGTIQPNSRIYFLHDANWDTTAVVGYDSTTGTWDVVQRYVYSPYGSLTILNADFSTPPSGTVPITDYLYQGMSLDPVTGLYNERNRNYSPSLGAWTSQDPLNYINGANTYQFVESDPVGMVDAEGTRFSIYGGSTQTVLELVNKALSSNILSLKTQVRARYQAGDTAKIWAEMSGTFYGRSSGSGLSSYDLALIYGLDFKTRSGASISSMFREQLSSGAGGPTSSAGLSLLQPLGNGSSLGAGATAEYGPGGYAFSAYQRLTESIGGLKTNVNIGESGSSNGPSMLSPSLSASMPIGTSPISIGASAGADYYPGSGAFFGHVSGYIAAKLQCPATSFIANIINSVNLSLRFGVEQDFGSSSHGLRSPGSSFPGTTVSADLVGTQ